MFSKKPADPPPVINHLSAHMHQRLDEAERALCQIAQEQREAQRAALELVAKSIAPKAWEAAIKAGKVTAAGAPDIAGAELAAAIITEFYAAQDEFYQLGRQDGVATAGHDPAKLEALTAAQQQWPQAEAQLRAANAQLQARIAHLQAQLAAAEAENTRLTAVTARPAVTTPSPEKWAPDGSAAPGAAPPAGDEGADTPADVPLDAPADLFTPVAPENVWPAWFGSWVSARTFGHGRIWLQILGQTGEPLRTRVSTWFAERRGIKPDSGGERRAIADLIKWELIQNVPAYLGKRAYALVALTERGADAFRLLYGTEPVAQHYPQLLARHKSANHTLLILLTQEALERSGYQVERYPEPVKVGELGTMHPDLVAYRGGRTHYIEAEADAVKNNDELAERKWRRVFVATGGRGYVSIPTRQALETTRSAINKYSRDFPEVKMTYMIVDQALGALDHYGPDASIWQK